MYAQYIRRVSTRAIRFVTGWSAKHSLAVPSEVFVQWQIDGALMSVQRQAVEGGQPFTEAGRAVCLLRDAELQAFVDGEGSAVEQFDFICNEVIYGPRKAFGWDGDHRFRAADLLSNCLNSRRAIRELVTAELRALNESISTIQQKHDRIEAMLNEDNEERVG